MRQPETGILVRSLGQGFSGGSTLPPHSHDWGQLVYACEGVMTVHTEAGTWVVPPTRAVWIPPGVEHSIEMSGWVAMRTLYLEPHFADGVCPERCAVVQVPPLLRELILHAVATGPLAADEPTQARLAAILLDQLQALPAVPLELPLPADARARRVADRIAAAPDQQVTLDALARGSGASRRTLERLFRAETGMSLGRWRQQARLLHALRLLAAGRSVGEVAWGVGYESPSAFIAMFRCALGTTPSRYYASSLGADADAV